MNKHKIKAGDTVRIIANFNYHNFEIGQEVKVDKICNEGCENEYLICSDKDGWWYVSYDDVEPTTNTHTFDGGAMFNQKGELGLTSLFIAILLMYQFVKISFYKLAHSGLYVNMLGIEKNLKSG